MGHDIFFRASVCAGVPSGHSYYRFTYKTNHLLIKSYKPMTHLTHFPMKIRVDAMTPTRPTTTHRAMGHANRLHCHKICDRMLSMRSASGRATREQTMAYQVHLSPKSANAKTGPIPVSTTTRATCPTTCAMRDACYASSGPLALHWSAVSSGARGTDWSTFVDAIAQLPAGQLWRHNQAGDLPGDGATVDPVALGQLVAANRGRRGFTYSHYRDGASLSWIKTANEWGFTVNLSANDLADADTLADTGAGPVVCVLPSTTTENTRTPAGRRVVVCPATQRDDVSCATCQLCARQRDVIVGFPAHGSRKRVIDIKLGA